MSSQRENVRRALDGENAYQPFKSLTSIKKTTTTLSKPLQAKNRNALKEAITSSKSTTSYKVFQKQQVYVDKEVEPEEIIKTQDTQADTEESIKQEFFDDNKTRYSKTNETQQQHQQEEEEEFMEIVPILPIKVPERLRHKYEHILKPKTESTESTKPTVPTGPTGSKRSHQNETEEEEINTEKKQKYSHKELFRSNATAISIEITKETKKLELLQETRAKMAMLQTSETLKEHQLSDPMLVAEYAGEIFGYFFEAEPKSMADPSYALNLQHEVTWKMRGVLIDWVIEIHYLFQLLPETLFLAVNIIDRFLSLRTVVLSKLQLVGITSLFIAAKFEEISCPTMQDFLYMTDNAVKEDELIKAERFILQVLDFHLCYPNPVNFLRRVCTDELKCNIHTRTLAKYFMEISCIDHRFIGIRPSKIAAASLWLSKKMLANGKWNSNFSRLAGYTPEELKPTVETMLDFLAQPVAHDAFFKKWATLKLSKASIFVRDWINRYYISE